jgi:uncharacterized protein (DUF983 family)
VDHGIKDRHPYWPAAEDNGSQRECPSCEQIRQFPKWAEECARCEERVV